MFLFTLGQEEGAASFDGEVRITPFNMKEELEEGHFDTEGNYHWSKDVNIKDNWLDNIDWVKVIILMMTNLRILLLEFRHRNLMETLAF